jgi:hypothetical protein
VVVVTWHSSPIDWLAALPASRVQVALYLKHENRSCDADVPLAVRPLLAFCAATPNAGGREAHTAALFITQFYDTLPQVVFFAHDDCVREDEEINGPDDPRIAAASGACGVLKLALWDGAATRAWVAAHVAHPRDAFASSDSCLCNINHEGAFAACPLAAKVPAGVCYGEGYLPMAWLLRTFLGHETPEAWQHIRWPSRAQLAVPGTLIRRRPRLLYVLLRELLAADWADESRERTADEAPALLHVLSPGPVHKRWSSLQWAHSLERLWFAVFDPSYTPYKHGNTSH